MAGYAISLALIALLLELAAGRAHRRSLARSTAGSTYHPDRDIWRCPRDQHLFPIFSDSVKGVVVYRAPASACNSCRSKAACTDSDHGREIERRDLNGVEYGMKQFHRVMSITLLLLAGLILIVELFRVDGLCPRAILIAVLTLFCLIIQRLWANISRSVPRENAAIADRDDCQMIERLQRLQFRKLPPTHYATNRVRREQKIFQK